MFFRMIFKTPFGPMELKCLDKTELAQFLQLNVVMMIYRSILSLYICPFKTGLQYVILES